MDSEIIKKHIENFLSLQQVKEIIENSGKNKFSDKSSKIFINVENESENNFILEINSDKAQGFSGFRKKYSNLENEQTYNIKTITERNNTIFYNNLPDNCLNKYNQMQCFCINTCKQCFNANSNIIKTNEK